MNIFTLTGSILVDSAQAEKSISKTGDDAEGLGKKLSEGIKTAGKWAAGVTAAAAAVGGAMLAAAKDTSEQIDAVDKASQRMGIAAESYQELAYAAELSGVEMSTLEKAAKKLEGTDLSMDDALAQIYELGSAEERAAKAAELFGNSVAYQMTPMLNASAEEMASMKEEAHDLGLVMSNDTVAAGAEMNDMFTKVEKSIEALKNNLVTDMMPYVMDILQWVIDNMPMIQEAVSSVMDAVWPIVKNVLDLIMKALPPLLDAVKSLLDWIMPYLKPVLEGVAGLVEGMFKLLDGDVEGFAESVKDVLVALGEALFGIGKDIFTSLWDGIKNVWESISSWVSEKVSWLTDKLAFWRKGSGEMQAQPDGSHAAGLPVVPYDGYVAELHRGESIMNAGMVSTMMDMMSKLASKPAQAAGPFTFVMEVDGSAIARATFDANQNETTRKGGSLVLV